MNYQVNGFDFLTKNFNKRVHNRFIKAASWIDTTTNVQQSLVYQQTLFDICEIYTIAEELNNKFMTEFAKRRIDYDRETKFGSDEPKQKEWESQIHKELTELSDYYDK